MLRKFLLIALLLGSFFEGKGSHLIAGFLEYKIDSAQQTLEVEYHLVLDSSGVPWTLNNINMQGPLTNFSLQRDTIIPFSGYIPGQSCPGSAYYEAIFKGSFQGWEGVRSTLFDFDNLNLWEDSYINS